MTRNSVNITALKSVRLDFCPSRRRQALDLRLISRRCSGGRANFIRNAEYMTFDSLIHVTKPG